MFRPLRRPDEGLSDQAYVELVRSLFALPLPSAIMSALFVGIALLAVRVTGDPALIGLTVAGTLASAARLAVVMSCRRAGIERQVRNRSDAARAERRFAAGYLVFATLLGLFGARVLVLRELGLHMVATALLVGYAAGAAAGVSLRPRLCAVSILLAVLPAATVCLLTAEPYHLALAIVLLALLVGGLQSIVARYRTEVDKIELRRQVALLARRDHLTGLLNRLGLAEQFEAATADRPADWPIAIHCLDLDGFKLVNDRHGHPIGDVLLRLIADRLGKNLRAGDVACRLGGDEFVVLQTGLRNDDEADALARRLVQRLGEPYQVGERAISVGVSVGYASAGTDAALDELLIRADNALYAVKAIGGGAAGHSDLSVGKTTVSVV